ncbi:hypothetical protein HWV62_4017 [Athelia sp. TMB]|nr:hypothetical protein HWV62_4017 [Athelia sp. TMB]
MPSATFRTLDVVIVGAGLSGLSAAIALRREGHRVRIFDKRDVASEVGNSISMAKNGGQWVAYWGVDIQKGLPINLQELCMRDYKTGAVDMLYDLSDYESKWGHPYWMLHRQDMHKMLLDAALSEEGRGTPCTLQTGYGCQDIDFDTNAVTFSNGEVIHADLIVGADGVVSQTRKIMDLEPEITPATSTCYRCNVYKSQLKDLDLERMADPAIQYWGGFETPDINKYNKIVMSPCNGGNIISFYCFFPAEQAKTFKEGFNVDDIPLEDLLAPYSELDPDCFKMLQVSVDRKPWRLYKHAPLAGWTKGAVALLGDAAHGMFPHQSQ